MLIVLKWHSVCLLCLAWFAVCSTSICCELQVAKRCKKQQLGNHTRDAPTAFPKRMHQNINEQHEGPHLWLSAQIEESGLQLQLPVTPPQRSGGNLKLFVTVTCWSSVWHVLRRRWNHDWSCQAIEDCRIPSTSAFGGIAVVSLESMATHGSGTPGRRGSNIFPNRSWPSVWHRIFWGNQLPIITSTVCVWQKVHDLRKRHKKVNSKKRWAATTSSALLKSLKPRFWCYLTITFTVICLSWFCCEEFGVPLTGPLSAPWVWGCHPPPPQVLEHPRTCMAQVGYGWNDQPLLNPFGFFIYVDICWYPKSGLVNYWDLKNDQFASASVPPFFSAKTTWMMDGPDETWVWNNGGAMSPEVPFLNPLLQCPLRRPKATGPAWESAPNILGALCWGEL